MSGAVLRSWLTAALLMSLTAASARAQDSSHGSAPSVTADDKEARELFRLGKQAFDESRFERALKYFQDAYELSHRAALLSNIGTALDRLRRDREAVEAYESYLAQVPDATNRELIEARVRIIKQAMDKSEPGAHAQPGPQPPAAELAPTPAEAARAGSSDAAAPTAATAALRDQAPDSGGITTRWWFWTGLGALVAGAVVVGIVASSGTHSTVESPALSTDATRVRAL
jgi:tetratricopeptide (TPR) repeat protein